MQCSALYFKAVKSVCRLLNTTCRTCGQFVLTLNSINFERKKVSKKEGKKEKQLKKERRRKKERKKERKKKKKLPTIAQSIARHHKSRSCPQTKIG